jgi:hypothetical protein
MEPLVIDERDLAEAVDDEIETGVWAELRELGAFGKVWTGTVILFCVLRAVIVWPALIKYDINPWWFVVLDIGTAPTYGLGQAMAVKILRNERRRMKDAIPWVIMVIGSFVAPYGYVLASAGHLPAYIIVGVVLWMGLFGGMAAYRMAKEVRVDSVTT